MDMAASRCQPLTVRRQREPVRSRPDSFTQKGPLRFSKGTSGNGKGPVPSRSVAAVQKKAPPIAGLGGASTLHARHTEEHNFAAAIITPHGVHRLPGA